MRDLRVDVLRSFAGYVALFTVFALPWLRVAAHATPVNQMSHPADDRVVAWILGWVAHAVATDPRHLMDANINYPAPGQLAAIEHFLSAQVVFAPVFWLSGNAVLGANLAVLLSYPVAALAMERLLLALGCGRLAAWTAGLVFALGPLRVPGHLMLVKFSNLYFPLVALSLTRLRQQTTARAAALAGLVLVFAFLSSYYLAVMAAVLAGLWAGIELLQRGGGRLRFVVLAAAAAAAATMILAGVSLPYLLRPEASGEAATWTPIRALGNANQVAAHLRSIGHLPLALAACGLVGMVARAPAARRIAIAGLAISIVAYLLMRGPVEVVHGVHIPMPYALIQASPARVFRAPSRFVVLLGFGTALLAAAALETIARSPGRNLGNVAIIAVAAAVLATRGWSLAGNDFTEFTGQSDAIYDEVRDVTRGDPGALVELPAISPAGALAHPERPSGTEVEAMLASTRHWLPLINGATQHPPPHRAQVNAALSRLPAGDAVDDLVDMVHLRWILLRPSHEWSARSLPTRAALLALPHTLRRLSAGGWDLLRLDRPPQHPEWFAAIAAGPRPDRTVLGTPLAPLDGQAAHATVVARVPPAVFRARRFPLAATVSNLGTAAWPVAAPPGAGEDHIVQLVARWWPGARGAETPPSTTEELSLWRDVPAGEWLTQEFWVAAPGDAGPFDLELRVRQRSGSGFDGAGNAAATAHVMVVPTEPGPLAAP